MCGRFALDLELDQMIATYLVDHNRYPDWAPRWNIAPTQQIPILIDRVDERGTTARTLGPARWSLTPRWSKTLELDYPTFNARSESAGEKPSFRNSLASHRALIPASAYYEWHTEGNTKTPYALLPADHSAMAFAGLFSTWSNAERSVVTATVLTTDARPNLSWLHPRSPVIVPREHWQRWLDPGREYTQSDLDEFLNVLRAHPTELEYHQVAPLRGEGAELLRPIGDAEGKV